MLEQLRENIHQLKEKSAKIAELFAVKTKAARIKELNEKMSAPGFWEEGQNSAKVVEELKSLKKIVEPVETLEKKAKDLEEFLQIIEAHDEKSLGEIERDLTKAMQEADALELKALFSEPEDLNHAILSIHAGAGGTESCDWAAMLLRMYSRWAENKGFSVQTLDFLAGEEAGFRNVTVLVKGENAYGYLKAEIGVHRLVRISPFDANKRRHTSFASVDVIPEISDEIKIEIDEKDLQIDVYRSSGPGGQGVNTTDSAVRITHRPSGIVVQCQNERSQLKNKAMAMKVLRARLYEKEKAARAKEMEARYGQKQEIAWGSQIRSYVLQPYTMVKDHRTNLEKGNAQAVLDGEIDEFIDGFIRFKVQGAHKH